MIPSQISSTRETATSQIVSGAVTVGKPMNAAV
jgi:hypothetical protein